MSKGKNIQNLEYKGNQRDNTSQVKVRFLVFFCTLSYLYYILISCEYFQTHQSSPHTKKMEGK